VIRIDHYEASSFKRSGAAASLLPTRRVTAGCCDKRTRYWVCAARVTDYGSRVAGDVL